VFDRTEAESAENSMGEELAGGGGDGAWEAERGGEEDRLVGGEAGGEYVVL
jgi:hypothetical protein